MCKLEKKERILKVALNLFAETGFHGTPTSLIAKEAGVANGTLFNHFKTKDILIEEIYFEIERRRNEFVMKDIKGNLSLKKKLYKVWRNSILWGIENKKEKRFFENYKQSYGITKSSEKVLKKESMGIWLLFKEFGEKKGLSKDESILILLNFIGGFIFTGEYFQYMESEYDESISKIAFERFCKGIDLTDMS